MTKRVELNPVIVRSFLTALIVTAFIGVLLCNEKVHAEEGDKTIAFLGTSSNGLSIADPVYPHNDTFFWNGSYVYFGKYEGKSVKYRVLQRETTDYGGKTMFLDCNNVLYNGRYGAYHVNMDTAWQNSIIRSRLNNEEDGFLSDDNFSKIEKAAIVRSYRETHETYKYSDAVSKGLNDVVKMSRAAKSRTYRYEPLTGEKVFLLDPEDLYNKKYGYWEAENDDDNRSYSRIKNRIQGYEQFYWLRTPSALGNSQTTIVEESGDIYYNKSYDKIRPLGISPAFNLNLSEIMFTSLVSGTVGEAGAEYKFTLPDKRLGVSSNNAEIKMLSGDVYIPYRLTEDEDPLATQISMLVTDKAWNEEGANILDYQKIADVDSYGAGFACYSVPEEIRNKAEGEYKAYIIAETVNEGNLTDYAGEPFEIKLPEDNWASFVWVEGVDRPKDKYPFDREVEVLLDDDGGKLSPSVNVVWKDPEGNEITGNASVSVRYNATVTVTLNSGYAFLDDTYIYFMNLNGDIVNNHDNPDIVKVSADKKTVTIDCGEYEALKRKITGITAPYAPESFGDIFPYGSSAAQSGELEKSVTTTIESFDGPETVSMNVTWTVSGNYNSDPRAENVFRWTVNEDDYKNYNPNLVKLNGSAVVRNKGWNINSVTLEGFTEPELGKELVDKMKISVKHNGVSGNGVAGDFVPVAWVGEPCYPDDGYEELFLASGKAEWDVNYSAYVIIDAEDRYEFADETPVTTDGVEKPVEDVINCETVLVISMGNYTLSRNLIDKVTVSEIDDPVGEEELSNTASVSGEGLSSNNAVLKWKRDGVPYSGPAEWDKSYTAAVTVSANEGYRFTSGTKVYYHGKAMPDDAVTVDAHNSLTINMGSFDTKNRVIAEVKKPSYPDTFEKTYTADDVLSSDELGRTTIIRLKGNNEPRTVSCNVKWSLNGEKYDDTPSAVNYFYWYIASADIEGYNDEYVFTDGLVPIANKSSEASEEEKEASPVPVGDNMIGRSLTVLTDLYTISWNKAVSFDTRKHQAVGLRSDRIPFKAKHTKRKTCDVNVIIYKNGEVIDPSRYKLRTYDSRNASVSFDGITMLRDESPYFKIRFKGKGFKNEKKAFNDEKFYFGITPSVLTENNVRFGGIKAGDSGEVLFKKIAHNITVSGDNAFSKEVNLKYKSDEKKTDYVTTVDAKDQTVKVTGKNNYFGTVVYKKAG